MAMINRISEYSRKQLDKLVDFVKKPQIGANGLIWVKYNENGSFKSSVDKFFDQDQLKGWANRLNGEKGDLLLVMAGEAHKTRTQLSALRMEFQVFR